MPSVISHPHAAFPMRWKPRSNGYKVDGGKRRYETPEKGEVAVEAGSGAASTG
jgi:hypothetical protein